MNRRVIAVVATALAFGCGSPSSPTPTITQVGGLWAFSQTLTSATGGDCVGPSFQGSIGTTLAGTVAITQVGASLTATSTSTRSGATCQFTGTAGASSVVLNATSCQASNAAGFVCANGARRDIELVAQSYTGTLAAGAISGTGAESYNVYVAGTRIAAGVLTMSTTFRATRQ